MYVCNERRNASAYQPFASQLLHSGFVAVSLGSHSLLRMGKMTRFGLYLYAYWVDIF